MKIYFIVILCFVSNISGLPFGIIDGHDANEGQFPYQVSIQECTTVLWVYCEHLCGGSIISPKWIVTAGHCHDYGRKFQVVAGIYKLDEKSEFRQTVNVKQIIVHEKYIGNANPNDIALVELTEPLNFTERVKPLAVPASNYETTGPAITPGWGLVGHIVQHKPNILQWVELSIVKEDDCMSYFKAAFHNLRNPYNITTNVCTAESDNNHGICKGDSGGPLVQNDTLIGISSWVILPCGTKGSPSVFTKVSNYLSWISNHTNTSF